MSEGIRRTDLQLTSARYKIDKKLQKHAAKAAKARAAASSSRPRGCGGCCGSRQSAAAEDYTYERLPVEGGVTAAAAGTSASTVQGTAVRQTVDELGTLLCSHWEPDPSCRPGGPDAKIPCLVYLHGNCGCRVEALDVLQASIE